MKLFQDLNRYVTQNATVSLAGNIPVNVAECSNTIFQGLLALHVLRQEPESHHVIREYAENTLQIANSTGLYEFLHVMHTEVLREHARDEKSYFTKSEIDQQIRVTHEFLHACSEVTYQQSMQNQRLLQLESSYKITSTADKKLRRDVANWQKLDADTRWSVCQKLWENIHRTQGLRDLRNCLRRYVQEQKWPAPVTGEKPPVSAANRMQLLTRLPVVKENLEASQGVKDLEHALTKTQDHSYDHIDGIMKKISAKLGITPHELHQEFKKQHSMTPDDWVRIANVRAIRETSSSGGTSAGAIASVANPVGKVNRRPSLFGYVPEDSRPPKRKNIFQVGDQVKSRWGDRKDEKPHTITKIDGDFIHTDEQSFFNPENSLFHHENFVLYKRRQDM